jgi:hypothetical protein
LLDLLGVELDLLLVPREELDLLPVLGVELDLLLLVPREELDLLLLVPREELDLLLVLPLEELDLPGFLFRDFDLFLVFLVFVFINSLNRPRNSSSAKILTRSKDNAKQAYPDCNIM